MTDLETLMEEQGIRSPHWRPWSRQVWQRWYAPDRDKMLYPISPARQAAPAPATSPTPTALPI